MPVFRVCKRFVVESGHMLSRHPERCRFPHGHTRTIDIVIRASKLDENGMVLDFKALKLAIGGLVESLDHSMAINSEDPLLPSLKTVCAEGLIVFEGQDPTTEVIAEWLFREIQTVLERGFSGRTDDGTAYQIHPNQGVLERVRVWETQSTWAEYGE